MSTESHLPSHHLFRRTFTMRLILSFLLLFPQMRAQELTFGAPPPFPPPAGASCPSGMLSIFNGGPSCINDLQCQNIASGFFCLRTVGRCCAQISPPPGGYGVACSQDRHCLFPNGQCRNQVCYCRQGSNYNGMECIPEAACELFDYFVKPHSSIYLLR